MSQENVEAFNRRDLGGYLAPTATRGVHLA